MTVPKHLNNAAARMKEAAFRIEAARQGPLTCENQKAWLEALTDYCVAFSEVQAYAMNRCMRNCMSWPGARAYGSFLPAASRARG